MSGKEREQFQVVHLTPQTVLVSNISSDDQKGFVYAFTELIPLSPHRSVGSDEIK